MTPLALTTLIMLTLLGFVLSATFSGLETGIYSVNRLRLKRRVAEGNSAARRLQNEIAHPTRVLAMLLIGNNAANYLGSYALAALMSGAGLGDWTLIALQATVFTLLLFVFAETMPKELFRVNADHWMYAVSIFITGARWCLTALLLLPIVGVFSRAVTRLAHAPEGAVTERHRVGQLLQEGAGAGLLSVTQTTLAERALAMQAQTVADVMVPWSRASTIPADATHEHLLTQLRRQNFTRFPVLDGSGRVVGVLTWLDAVLAGDRPTRELMTPVLTLPPTTRLLAALSTLRSEHQSLAIVVDPASKRPLGLVSLKDLVEPLTGELAAW